MGKLSSDAIELEWQLINIFQKASAWNALLLLDETDVFLQSRAKLTLERNRIVGVFLRKLEYFDGVLFLTTNMVHNFDEAIRNRIQLKMQYHILDQVARKTVANNFLKRISQRQGTLDISEQDINRFATISMNGREVSLAR